MKLFMLTQTDVCGYDTYDACVVAAEDEAEAREITPNSGFGTGDGQWSSWARTPEKVQVEYIGEAAPGVQAGVILASFNAG